MQLNSSGYALMSNIAEEHLRALIEGERVNKLAIVLPPLVNSREKRQCRRGEGQWCSQSNWTASIH